MTEYVYAFLIRVVVCCILSCVELQTSSFYKTHIVERHCLRLHMR